jgi:hypothetical protein
MISPKDYLNSISIFNSLIDIKESYYYFLLSLLKTKIYINYKTLNLLIS